jgi:hypothetical protein
MTALKGSPYFSAVELSKTASKADKGMEYVEFTMTASLNYAPKAPGAAAQPPAPGAAPAGKAR